MLFVALQNLKCQSVGISLKKQNHSLIARVFLCQRVWKRNLQLHLYVLVS